MNLNECVMLKSATLFNALYILSPNLRKRVILVRFILKETINLFRNKLVDYERLV